jgi:beta-lactamase superfamily II metal-dependent hydrolase
MAKQLRELQDVNEPREAVDAASLATVYLLDVGPQEYGDALLCLFKDRTVLIDGAHPGNWKESDGHPAIQEQLADILHQPAGEIHVDLLMISHAHDDHIGCLPKIVAEGWLTADWALVPDPDLGWGRADDADAHRDDHLDAGSRQLVNALREEPRSPSLTDAELREFLLDADLEEPYRDMLNTLKTRGTKVRRFGRDSHADLVQAFSDIGLEILGPREPHLAVCAENVLQGRNDAIGFVQDRGRPDAATSPVEAYRALMRENLDNVDVKRYGHFVNLQSHVACFTVGDKRFFFAGDMQFSAPGTNNEIIKAEIERLKRALAERAPYAFFKLCHHGSSNGFSSALLDDLGTTRYIGICAGSGSGAHPAAEILTLLKNNASRPLTWARTDHNGQCKFQYTASKTTATVTKEHGDLNDPVPNKKRDAATSETLTVPAPPPPGLTPMPEQRLETPMEARVERRDDDRTVEVIAKLPHTRTRVTITIDIAPQPMSGNDLGPRNVRRDQEPSGLPASFALASGVQNLLVVTNRARLGQNIGAGVADGVIAALRGGGATVVDDLPQNADAQTTAQPVQAELRRHPQYKGVLLLGGYDVVPSQILDSLSPSLRRRVGTTGDPDNFIVWNDEVYGDIDNDLLPELPVSRIPDAHSSYVVLGALGAHGAGATSTTGIRNVARPFADAVYQRISRNGSILSQSQPREFNESGFKLQGDHVYIMLHGDYTDGSRFWGEETPNDLEAVNLSNIPDRTSSVIFTGCCWGALTVDRPAGRLKREQVLVPKRPESSIALTFLKNGAQAFVGCTGAHYSPQEPPYQYFGGPMHAAFWQNILVGKPPAAALFEAKREYMRGMPHGQTTPSSEAIEFKIWRQYACLGLGW